MSEPIIIKITPDDQGLDIEVSQGANEYILLFALETIKADIILKTRARLKAQIFKGTSINELLKGLR